jgi:alkylhydroperoxidase family enzyme
VARLELVPEEADDPVVAAVFAQVRARLPEVPSLYRVLAHSPAILRGWIDFAWPLRSEATTPRSLRELMIMRTAQLTDVQYEWHAHRPMALRSGVTQEQLDDLHEWPASTRFSASERLVLTFTDELTTKLEVSDDTFSEMQRTFTPQEMVELTVTAAFYSCVSRVLRAFGLGVSDLPENLRGS